MKRLKDIALYLFSVVGIMFISYLLIGGYLKKRSLNNNLRYSEAIIIGHFYTIRYTNYLNYTFVVDEKEYQGSGRYYPATDTFSVGDTILVVYDKTNPSNNKPSRDK